MKACHEVGALAQPVAAMSAPRVVARPFTASRMSAQKQFYAQAAKLSAGRRVLSVRAQAVEAPAEPATEPAVKPEPSYLSQSEKYAVIDLGGVQHLVEEGRWYTCNRLTAEPGATVQFGRVLAFKNEGKFHVGKPYLENIKVEAEILDEVRGPKLIVYKMKPKKHYQRKTGHRQDLTKFKVVKITSE